MFCSNCGTKNEDGAKFCANCGAAFEEKTEAAAVESAPVESAPVETAPVETAPSSEEIVSNYEETEEKKVSVKKIVTVAIIVAVVAAIALFAIKVIGGIFGEKDEFDISNHPLIYAKDDEVKVNPAGKKDAYELGDGDSISSIQVTDDGKYIFYGDDYDDGEFDLYYRKANSMNSEAKKIDKGINKFTIIPGTKNVVYLKDDNLIYHNLKKEIKIDNDVSYYSISEDGSKIAYSDDDETFYISNIGKNAKPQKIDSEMSVEYISDDYKTVYYTKEEKLYKKVLGKEKEKLASDVWNTIVIDEKIFVIKQDEKEYKFNDLFINDLEAPADTETLEYPFRYDFDNDEDYNKAYDAYWDAYNARNAYEGLLNLEEYYNENPVKISTYSIYELKGKELNKILENVESYDDDFGELGYGSYYKNAGDGLSKIKLSSVEDRWEASSKVNDKVYGYDTDSSLYLFTSDGKSILVAEDSKNIEDFEISEDGKEIYIFEKKEDKEEGEIKKYKIGSSKISGEKVVAKDVSYFSLWEGDNLIVTDEDDEKTLIRSNGKKVALGEDIRNIDYKDGVFYYIADYSDKSRDGDLTYCENGKVKKIADDVYDYKVFGEKRIAYIAEYDTDDGCGELYMGKKSGKAKLVDDEVSAIY